MGKKTPPELLFMLGKIVAEHTGGPCHDQMIVAVENARENGLVVSSRDRHNVWVVEGRHKTFLGPLLGFTCGKHAWVFWTGLGCPDSVEIRFVMNPNIVMDEVSKGFGLPTVEFKEPEFDS